MMRHRPGHLRGLSRTVWHRPGQCGIVPDIRTEPDRKMETTTTVIAELDGLRLSDWIESRNLSRSTGYELLKLLGIEPEARRVPTSRKPVSHLSNEQIEMLDPFATEINRGATLPQLRDRLGRSDTIPADGPGQSAIVPDAANGKLATLAPEQFGELVQALRSELVPASQGQLLKLDPEQLEVVVKVLAAGLAPQQPASTPAPLADPLRRAEGLARCADAGLVVTTDELKELGVKGAGGFSDGDVAYGFTFRQHNQRNRTLWTVEREITAEPPRQLPAATSRSTASTDRRVGFDVAAYLAPAAPVVDVTHETIGQRLFCTNRIG